MPWAPGHDFPLLDGHGDPELAPAGVEQAELVAKRLAGERVDAIYITTLRRTAQTAAPLARLTGLTPIVEADLREVMLGEWEGGVFRQKVADGHPIALEMFATQRWDVIPGAERDELFGERVTAAVNRLAERHPNERVVAVTHGGVIGEVMGHACGGRRFAFSGSDNCSISEVVVLGDRWMLRRFNDTVHLGPPA